jgi:tRNA-uridine 2-sulfurtransferase
VTTKKAVVAMSGGVDSSVAAALLVERGYDVTGIMLKLWRGEAANSNSGCCNLGAAEDARRVADTLGIPFYVLNFAEHFEDTVVKSFQNEYLAGRTPNPCVRCNQWIKFDTLLHRARTFGADVLATGHYARVRERDGRYRLLRGIDPLKDQSYVLWMLSQDELAQCMFPIGEMPKSQTRAIAKELGLRTAAKPDSQEICFVRGGDMTAYVDENLEGSGPGSIRDAAGNIVGTHRGIAHYTVGQRKGLGISAGVPLYVTSIDAATNTIVVGGRDELDVASFVLEEISYVGLPVEPGHDILVQHRAHGDAYLARAVATSDRGTLIALDSPIGAIAPGQSAALYSSAEPDELLGGGIIASTMPATAVGAGV